MRLLNQTTNGNYIVMGAISDTSLINAGYYPTVFTIDSTFQIISYKKFIFSNQNKLLAINTNIDDFGNFLLFGELTDGSNISHFLYQFNKQGDSTKAIIFGGYQSMEIHDCIRNKITKDYKLIVTGATLYSRGNVFALDSNLNFNYVDTLKSPNVNVILDGYYSSKYFNDSMFLLAGTWMSFNQTSDEIFIAKYNSATNAFITEMHFGKLNIIDKSPHYNGIDFLNKNNIYLGGTDNFTYTYSNIPNWLFIVNLDSNLNKRWQRFIGGDAEYTLNSISATNDGGCLLTALKFDSITATFPYQRNLILIKIDSLGNVTGSSGEIKMNSNKYIIYPNPSKTNFIIGGNINQIIKIEIFDMNNHCVYYQNINPSDCSLNLEFLNSGMYIYKITENDYSQTGKLVLD